MRHRCCHPPLVPVLVALGLAAAGAAAATAQEATAVSTCVDVRHGQARIVPAAEACAPDEAKFKRREAVPGVPWGPEAPAPHPRPAAPARPPRPARAAAAAAGCCEDCVALAGLPATISAPGRYCLAADVVVSLPQQSAILVAADDVVLDLKGFSITNTAAPAISYASGIEVNGRRVTVRNGTVRGFLYGVYFEGAADAGLVERIRAVDCSYGGIRVEGNATVVRGNQVVGTGGENPYGVGTNPAAAAGIGAYGTNHRVVDNDVADTHGRNGYEGWGVWMNACNSCVVDGNRVGNAIADERSVGIGAGWSERTLVVGNRILNVNVGIYAYTAGGILYRDNVTFACTVPYGTGTNGGNNQ